MLIDQLRELIGLPFQGQDGNRFSPYIQADENQKTPVISPEDHMQRSNPFENILNGKGNGQGTISGLVARLLGNDNPDVATATQGELTNTPSQPSTMLNPEPTATTKPGGGLTRTVDPDPNPAPGEAAAAVMSTPQTEAGRLPENQPTQWTGGMTADQIAELRSALYVGAGQRMIEGDDGNGLGARMRSPMSQLDMNEQRKETQEMHDSMRGFDGTRRAAISRKANGQ
jgi:hypothetical protein